jgi:RimJ/RimL family protein N-acetyltransferase
MIFSALERGTPVIDTPRLRLRAHRPDDLDASFAMWSDPDVTRFIGGRPFTREEVWGRLLRYSGMWAFMGHGFWAVEEKETGQMIGDVGIMEARRDIVPSFEGEPEVGWSLSPRVHGRGYATEAVGAALAWADAQLAVSTLVCIVSPGNAPSLRIAQKFGFRERIRTAYHGEPTIQFERSAPAASGRKSQ